MWQTAEGNETLIPENRSRLLSDLFDTVGTKQSTSIVDSAQLSPVHCSCCLYRLPYTVQIIG